MFAVTPLAILIIALTSGGIAKVSKMHEQPLVQASATVETIAAEPSADQVLASFEREFNHEAAPVKPARNESIEDDVLYLTVNAAHWTDDAPANQPAQYCEEEMMYVESCNTQLPVKDRVN